MRVMLALAMAAFLAGCSGGDGEPPTDASDPTASTTGPLGAMAVVQAEPWVAESVAVAFDGNLGTSVRGCVFPAGRCEEVEAAAGVAGVTFDRPGANFTGLDLTMTWTASTPATATLDLGFMVMASCDGCNSTSYEVVSGTSPLRATLSGVSVPMPSEDYVVHLYVYNPQGSVHDPAAPASGGVVVDQAFRLEGTVSFLVPPGDAARATAGA